MRVDGLKEIQGRDRGNYRTRGGIRGDRNKYRERGRILGNTGI